MPCQDTNIYNNIRKEFLYLLSISGYQKIKVKDIALKSGVSRQTFYANFPSKDELALSFLDDIFDDFFSLIEDIAHQNNNYSYAIILTHLYKTYEKHEKRLKIIFTLEISENIQRRFKNYVSRYIGSIMRKNFDDFSDPFYVDCLIGNMASTALSLAKIWIEKGMPISANKISELHLSLLRTDLPTLIKEISKISKS